MLTSDFPVAGKRERDLRTGLLPQQRFTLATRLDMLRRPHWLATVATRRPRFVNIERELGEGQNVNSFVGHGLFDASFSWDDVKRFRDRWPRKLLLKGVLRADDAERAVAAGVDGLVLSNHGGRQLDGAISGLDALPEVVRAVGGRAALLVDGGVRRGSDIAKAVALGAEGVLLGRAPVYGLAAGGEQGVARAISILADELDRTLALTGCPDIAALTADLIARHVNTPRHAIRSYVLRTGRITRAQTRALEELLPRFGIPYSESVLDLDAVFGRRARRALEIGFGNGDTLIELASKAPEMDFIGVEVHPPGIGHCLLAVESLGLTNVRVIAHDAVEVLAQQLAPASLDEVLLYFPDPWPKKRHHKRRIVQPAFAALVAESPQARRPVQVGHGLGALRRLDARSPRRVAGIHECRAGRRLRRSPGTRGDAIREPRPAPRPHRLRPGIRPPLVKGARRAVDDELHGERREHDAREPVDDVRARHAHRAHHERREAHQDVGDQRARPR